MIPLLGPIDPFPHVDDALDEPNGLLAAGGGLSVARLVDAYSRGIFPWFNEGDPVLWWCPDPRMVLPTDGIRISRSLGRRLARRDYEVTIDKAFADVLRQCAAPRRTESGTWLVPVMMRAYQRLHAAGLAHSVEIWMDGALAGGLYGVSMGRMFFGESMFARRTDASKMALAWLAAQLSRWHFPMIDCQMRTDHLASLGAIELPRGDFVSRVAALTQEPPPAPWQFDEELKARGPRPIAGANTANDQRHSPVTNL
jgi:leucyl/phenylalanyl-tRNA--protein transferase